MECGLTGEHGHPVARPVAMEREAVHVLVTIPLQLMMAHFVKVTQVTQDRASKIIVQVSLIQLLQNKNKQIKIISRDANSCFNHILLQLREQQPLKQLKRQPCR